MTQPPSDDAASARKELEAVRLALVRAQHEIRTVQQRADAAQQRALDEQQRAEAAERRRRAAQEELTATQRRLQAAAQAQHELQRVLGELAAVRGELAALQASRSWRITRPLRWVIAQRALVREQGLAARARQLLRGTPQPAATGAPAAATPAEAPAGPPELTREEAEVHQDLLAAIAAHAGKGAA